MTISIAPPAARAWHAVRVCAAALVLSGTIGATLAAGAASARQAHPENEPLDLAAMVLTPLDLTDAGLEDYRFWEGQTHTPDEVAAFFAEDWGEPEGEVRDALEDAGLVRLYVAWLLLQEDPDDPDSQPLRAVRTNIYAYADADGAEDSFAYLLAGREAAGATIVDDASPIGEDAVVTRGFDVDAESGERTPWLDLGFRLDNLVAAVGVYDYSGERPSAEVVTDLAETLAKRIETTRDGDRTVPGPRAVRLAGDEVVATREHYQLLDGEAIPLLGESARDTRSRGSAATDLGQVDDYVLQQEVAAADANSSVWFVNQLVRFTDEDAAEARFAGTEDRIDADDGFDDVEFDDEAPAIGDEAVAFAFASSDGDVRYRGLTVRVGETVALLLIAAAALPPAGAVEELAEAQADCLDDERCAEPLPLPDELAEHLGVDSR